jgi:hypothetical protein
MPRGRHSHRTSHKRANSITIHELPALVICRDHGDLRRAGSILRALPGGETKETSVPGKVVGIVIFDRFPVTRCLATRNAL